MIFDVFNGDADGICALIQLRLYQPLNSTLVTGIKRNIQLLDQLSVASGDQLTVLDISLQKNCSKVIQFLNAGASIFYVDHHQAGEIPNHPKFKVLINTDNTLCTSLLINQHLQGKHPLWAITGAFGDNLDHSAEQLAKTQHLKESELAILRNLGIYVNYNSYGHSIDDLHFSPDKLYLEMAGYISPFDFVIDNRTTFLQLETGYQEDMLSAQQVNPDYQSDAVSIYILPDVSWARRINGVFGNYLANLEPNKAHAVVTCNFDNGYQVSVRAPLSDKFGADEVCSLFSSGGGRKAAAGINHLPSDQLAFFISEFERFYGHRLGL
jgi:hypothetical protein